VPPVRRRALPAAVFCALLVAGPAQSAPVVGIADQNVSPADPLFAWTGIRTLRTVAPWDAALAASPELDARLHAMRAAAIEPLVDGEVWITETGGIVSWTRWPYDEARARASVERAFALADARADRIARLYLYQWRAGPAEDWDSGLLRPDGSPRPSFAALAERLRPREPVPPPPRAEVRGRALRIVRRPWIHRRGVILARVACAPWRTRACQAALVARRRPFRVGRPLPVALAVDRRRIAPGRAPTLRIRLPARLRRGYVELRLPGRAPLRSVLRGRGR
jgi:hypothetical protein